ncbi:MAG TPA: diaminopimelate epimerase [Bacteroides sp.]|nr:diaminopimelate epimerase [Bacteroides sp.]
MSFNFHKYHGTGNDFIIINDPRSDFPEENYELIRHLCERRFGIGADGLILIRNHVDMDFRMVYFNSNGKEGSMCGNGGRCAVAFAYREGLCRDSATFMAIDGTHVAKVIRPEHIQLKMQPVKSIRIQHDHYELDTGSPHYVTFVDQVEEVDVYKLGQEIRLSNAFRSEGINVNFVEHGPEHIIVRTYERGVENETFSCGTGVVASALCASLRESSEKTEYQVRTKGGDLNVSFRIEGEHSFRNIILVGPAEFVYQGTIET